jgi:hypothetical protein
VKHARRQGDRSRALFAFAGFASFSIISIMRGTASFETGHATGVSAAVGAIVEIHFNSFTWLVILAAFGGAV